MSNGSFGIDVKKYAQKTGLTLQKSVVAICVEATQVIPMTPKDTGRTQSNWFASIDSVSRNLSDSRSEAEAFSTAKSEVKSS